jgi:hypothetical protein
MAMRLAKDGSQNGLFMEGKIDLNSFLSGFENRMKHPGNFGDKPHVEASVSLVVSIHRLNYSEII